MTVRELPKGIDAELVRSMMSDSEKNYETLEEAWDSLLGEHEGEWVAVHAGQFLFGDSPQAVVEQAKKTGWPLAVIAIDRLSRERPAILLQL